MFDVMAGGSCEIYLKESVFDFGLLPFVKRKEFEFPALLSLADDFYAQGIVHLEREKWSELGMRHLGLETGQSLVYYDYFKTWSFQKGMSSTVSVDVFVLFLFNQLFGKSNVDDFLKEGDSYPNVIVSSTSRRKRTRTPPSSLLFSASHMTLDSVVLSNEVSNNSTALGDSSSVNALGHGGSLPSLLVEGRSNLSAFWLSNASQWQSLLYVIHRGRHLSSDIVKPQSDAEACGSADELWGSRLELPLACFSALDRYFECYVDGKYYPMELALALLYDGSLCEGTKLQMSSFYQLYIDSMCISITPGHSAAERTDERPLHIVRKKRRTLVLTAEQLKNRSIVLSALVGCHVYLLGPVKNVLIQQSQQVTVTVGACSGIVHIDDCQFSVVRAACRQVVCSGVSNSLLYLYSHSAPLMFGAKRDRRMGWTESPSCALNGFTEKLHCSNVLLAPINFTFAGMREQFESCGLLEHRPLLNRVSYVWTAPVNDIDSAPEMHRRKSTEESLSSDKSSAISGPPTPNSTSPISFTNLEVSATYSFLSQNITGDPVTMASRAVDDGFKAVGSCESLKSGLGPGTGVYLLPPAEFSEHTIPLASSLTGQSLLESCHWLKLPNVYAEALKSRRDVASVSKVGLSTAIEHLKGSESESKQLKLVIDQMFLAWLKQQLPGSPALGLHNLQLDESFYPKGLPLPVNPEGAVSEWKSNLSAVGSVPFQV